MVDAHSHGPTCSQAPPSSRPNHTLQILVSKKSWSALFAVGIVAITAHLLGRPFCVTARGLDPGELSSLSLKLVPFPVNLSRWGEVLFFSLSFRWRSCELWRLQLFGDACFVRFWAGWRSPLLLFVFSESSLSGKGNNFESETDFLLHR